MAKGRLPNSKPGKSWETIPTGGEGVSNFTRFSQLRGWEMVFMRRRGGPDLHQPSQLVKNSQLRWGGGGSGEVGMVSQLLPGFEFRSLP